MRPSLLDAALRALDAATPTLRARVLSCAPATGRPGFDLTVERADGVPSVLFLPMHTPGADRVRIGARLCLLLDAAGRVMAVRAWQHPRSPQEERYAR